MATTKSPGHRSPEDRESGERKIKLKKKEKREGVKGPAIKKIQASTKAKAEAAHKSKSQPQESNESKLKKKVDRFFRWALAVSFLAHSPLMVGSALNNEENKKWVTGFFDFGGTVPLGGGAGGKSGESKEKPELLDETPPQWEEEVRESLKKELGEKDAEKVIGEIDPEALEGFKKAQDAIKERQAERAGRVDKQKLEEYKKNLLERLENGEKILYRDFVFELELLGLGIDPAVIEEAKKIFMEEMAQLEKMKPSVPTREFLQKVVNLSESDEKNNAYEPTRTSLAEYLVRKKQGKRGNCKARGKYQAMAVEYLYPERRKDILLQKFGDHIRALFEVDENIYVMEPGVQILTKDDLKGTITFTLDEHMLSSAGKKIVKHVDEVAEEKPRPDLPTINDDTAFVEPKADGKLKDFSKNHQFLYKDKFTPPETEKKKLEPSSKEKKKRNEQITQEFRQKEYYREYDEQVAKYKRNLERAQKAGQIPPFPPNPEGVLEAAEWVVVLNDGAMQEKDKSWDMKDLDEILPWQPKDYDNMELSDRISGTYYNAGKSFYGKGTEMPGLINPSVATIKKINGFAVENVKYEEGNIFSKKVWDEIFNTPAKKIDITLNSAYLSLPFDAYLGSPKYDSVRKYTGELELYVGAYVDPHGGKPSVHAQAQMHVPDYVEQNYKGYVQFSPEQFKLLMNGDGGLTINYSMEKNFSDDEIRMIANSSRPYVMLKGPVCNFRAQALKEMQNSKKTVLVLSEQLYFEVMHLQPDLLLEPHIKMNFDYFQADRRNMYPSDHALFNAYYLRETLSANMASNPAVANMVNKLNELILTMETEFMRIYIGDMKEKGEQGLNGLKGMAKGHFNRLGDTGPIGCMGMCLPPEGAGDYYQRGNGGNIKQYQAQKGQPQQGMNQLMFNENGVQYEITRGSLPGTFMLRSYDGATINDAKTVYKDEEMGGGLYYYIDSTEIPGLHVALTPLQEAKMKEFDK